jgi:hypothetical protein
LIDETCSITRVGKIDKRSFVWRPQSRQSAKLFLGGGAHSLAGERVGGVPIPTRGHALSLWYSR